MSDVEAALVAMLAMALAISAVALLVWAVSAARRGGRRRRREEDVVIDLTYMEEAVRRQEETARREAELRRERLSEPRSTWPEGGGR